jgi:exopolyphosphatase/pppGpp-phosphohydrolase
VAVEATRQRIGAEREALAVIDVGGGSTEVAWRERAADPSASRFRSAACA